MIPPRRSKDRRPAPIRVCCPGCGQGPIYRGHLLQHLVYSHGMDREDAQQVAFGITPSAAAPTPTQNPEPEPDAAAPDPALGQPAVADAEDDPFG